MTAFWCATFRTSIPDDTIEDDHDIVQAGGKAVAEALGELLAKAGYAAALPVDEGLNGWTINVRRSGARYTIQIAIPDEVELLIMPRFWPPGWLGARDRAADQLLLAIDDALRGDPRFGDIRWEKSDSRRRTLATFTGPPIP